MQTNGIVPIKSSFSFTFVGTHEEKLIWKLINITITINVILWFFFWKMCDNKPYRQYRIQEDVSTTLEKIKSHEKYINMQLEPLVWIPLFTFDMFITCIPHYVLIYRMMNFGNTIENFRHSLQLMHTLHP